MGVSMGGGGGAMADINITPLVDVMLVLLIIFMVTAPMMNTAGVEVDLPRSEAPPLDSDPDQLVLSIDRDGAIYLGEYRHAPDELPEKLAAIVRANPDQPVFLRADGEVPYKEVAALVGLARSAGIPRVGLVFEPGTGELRTPATP